MCNIAQGHFLAVICYKFKKRRKTFSEKKCLGICGKGGESQELIWRLNNQTMT